MIHEATGIQYEIMTTKEEGNYIPNFEMLIEEAPNKEIAHQWEKCRNLIEKTKDQPFKFGGFSFKLVCCVQQSCGHYEIFQHPYGSAYTDIDKIMESFANENRKCTRCICG